MQGGWQEWDGSERFLTRDWSCDIAVKWRGKPAEFRMFCSHGLRTDGGSIPRSVQGWIQPFGKGLPGYLAHDFLYGGEFFTREFNDLVLYGIIRWVGFSWVKAQAVHKAVRTGGYLYAYRKHTTKSVRIHRELIRVLPLMNCPPAFDQGGLLPDG